VDKDSTSINQARPRWFIDLAWYQQNNRSFLTLAEGRLCPKCRDRLGEREGLAEELLANIRDCCSKNTGFITRETPILESIFRLFLANGNQPLDLEELVGQLSEWHGGDVNCPSVEVLSRLLSSDQCYGFGDVPG